MKVILGLGTNCGSRLDYLREAIFRLARGAGSAPVRIRSISPIYESDAMLPEGAPSDWNQPFLNLAVLAETPLSALELLQAVKRVEAEIGRKDRGRWAPREIDIDLLAIGPDERLAEVFRAEALSVPHAGLLDRPFALLPLADLVPEWRVPEGLSGAGARAAELAACWRFQPPGSLSERVPFRTRQSSLSLARLMAVLNVTPDSFSDGGRFIDPVHALEQARRLVAAGADVIDVGAESTRPGAETLSPSEEWRRLEPVLRELQGLPERFRIRLSLDSRNPSTVTNAVRQGWVDWINDVSGFESAAMRRLAAESGAELVFMHSLTVPASRTEVLPDDVDPVDELLRWADRRIRELEDAGVRRDRMIFDPGIGFGKTAEQSVYILQRTRRFHELGVKILIGHSRKSFMSLLSDRAPAERDFETALVTQDLALKGVDVIRVHEIEPNLRALRVMMRMGGVVQWQDR